MTLNRYLDAVFTDPRLVATLTISAIITGLTLLFTPLLVGLLGWTVLFGAQVEIARALRRGARHPLPRWNNFEALFQQGWRPLIAWFIYSLPLVFIQLIGLTFGQIGGGFGTVISLALTCLSLPLTAAYLLLVYPAFSIGLGRSADLPKPTIAVFFQFGSLWRVIRAHGRDTLIYAALALATGAVLGLLYVIPCIGWIAALALTIPLTGTLGGLYAAVVTTPSPLTPPRIV